jgi:serine/threonine-protein kinase
MLDERYRIETVLGSGGMGSVYLATDLEENQQVAIKEMHAAYAGDEQGMRQLRHEALVLTQLDHPLLPKVYDYFEMDNIPHLVMEYIKGRNLSTVVGQEEDPLPVPMVLKWAAELCDVLQYLHTHNPPVVFRDVKPGNIMLGVDGHIKLVDFGISKLFEGGHAATATFARGATSPGYTALEQYSGGTDARSDIYSLGATLYAILAYQIPPDALQRAAELVRMTPLRKLRPDVPEPLAHAIESMLEVKAADRPESIAEVRQILGLAPVPKASETDTAPIDHVPMMAAPRRSWIPLVTVVAAGLVLIAAWLWLHRPPAPTPHPPIPSPHLSAKRTHAH